MPDNAGDVSSIPGLGRSSGEGNGNPLQYSGWKIPWEEPGRLQSMGFSRQECWSGLPFPSPGNLPNPGIEPGSPALPAGALPSEPPYSKQCSPCLPAQTLLADGGCGCLGCVSVGSYRWARNLWVLIIYLFFLPVMLPSEVPRLATNSPVRVFPGVWKLLSF